MFILIVICVLVAVVAWLFALISAMRLFSLRQDEIRASEMIFNGAAWFRASTFKPVAAPVHRQFLLASGVFFVAILLLIASTFLARL